MRKLRCGAIGSHVMFSRRSDRSSARFVLSRRMTILRMRLRGFKLFRVDMNVMRRREFFKLQTYFC